MEAMSTEDIIITNSLIKMVRELKDNGLHLDRSYIASIINMHLDLAITALPSGSVGTNPNS